MDEFWEALKSFSWNFLQKIVLRFIYLFLDDSILDANASADTDGNTDCILQEYGIFEYARWFDLISEQEQYFLDGAISRREEEIFLTGGNFFSENGSLWTLLFGLKKE